MTRSAVGTIVREARCRETGATTRVERSGPGSWIEQEEGWVTLCLQHATCVVHPTRSLAEWHAVSPSGWCQECRAITEGEAPRITEPYRYEEEA